MARPYSADLRERVLLAHEHGEAGATLRERVLLAHEHGEAGATALARRFRIGLSTLYRWLGELQSEGRRAARPMGHGCALLGGAEDVLRALVADQNDATLAEYAERFAARTGQRRSPSAICRALQRLNVPRKKSRSVPRNRTARTWLRPGRRGIPSLPGSRRSGWSSSSMRVASTRV